MEENHSIGRKSLHWKEIIPLEGNHSIGRKSFQSKWPPCWPPPYIPNHPRNIFKTAEMLQMNGKKILFQCRNLKNITASKSFHWKEIILMEEYHSIGRKSFQWKKIIPLEGNHSNGRKSFQYKWPPCWPPPYIPNHPSNIFKTAEMFQRDEKEYFSMQNSKEHHWK